MKKITLFGIIVALIIALSSCVNPNIKRYNDQQTAFDKFLSARNKQKYDFQNDIQKDEFFRQFESDLYNYVDSVKLFVNWTGRIFPQEMLAEIVNR